MKYQAYSEYKDSGIEWLGDVPPHWVTLPLKRVCSLVTGLTPPTSNEAHYIDYDSGRPWIRPDDLNEEGVVTRASKFLSQSGWGLMKIVPKGSTLICCIGTIGKAGYIDVDVSTNQQITSASFRQNPRYYYYLVRAAKKVFEETATGNVIRILNSERLGGVPFLSVPIDEAKKIADFLDHETAKIDNLIEKQQQLITLLKEKRQAVISHAVTKGLNPDAPMRDSGVEWLGEVPEEWKVSPLSYLTHEVTVGVVVTPAKYYEVSGVPCLRSLNVGAGYLKKDNFVYISEQSNELLSKSKIYSGDIVIVRTGQPGTASVVDDDLDNCNCIDLIIIRKTPKLVSKFLEYQINSNCVKIQVSAGSEGAIQQHFNVEVAKSLKIIAPTLDEQIDIVKYLDTTVKKLDNLDASAKTAMKLLQERRSALISAAVTGKIDVRNWQAPTPTANQPDDKAVAT